MINHFLGIFRPKQNKKGTKEIKHFETASVFILKGREIGKDNIDTC